MLLITWLSAFAATSAFAADKKAHPKPVTPTPKPHPVPETAPAATPAPAARSPKPRVYTFGGLDVDGKLKTPQLLFFRSRVKQELDTSSPEKRSFMKELQRTADDKGL